ncbi:glycerate kinase, partial [Salmonella enterica subsp. enterica serovar Infantis]
TLARRDLSGRDQRVSACHLALACAVTTPRPGKEGASAVFGPQTGATPEMIERLDTALTRYAHLIARDLHVDVLDLACGG